MCISDRNMFLDTNVCDHWNSQSKHYQADSDGEFDSVRTKCIRPIVDHTGYERFHDAKFTVDAEYLHENKMIRI